MLLCRVKLKYLERNILNQVDKVSHTLLKERSAKMQFYTGLQAVTIFNLIFNIYSLACQQ